MVRRFGQWMTGALVVWAIFLAIAWVNSEGEPVCEGIFITETAESFPPKCPSPFEGALQVGPALLGLVVLFGLIGFLATTGLVQIRERKDVASEDDS